MSYLVEFMVDLVEDESSVIVCCELFHNTMYYMEWRTDNMYSHRHTQY